MILFFSYLYLLSYDFVMAQDVFVDSEDFNDTGVAREYGADSSFVSSLSFFILLSLSVISFMLFLRYRHSFMQFFSFGRKIGGHDSVKFIEENDLNPNDSKLGNAESDVKKESAKYDSQGYENIINNSAEASENHTNFDGQVYEAELADESGEYKLKLEVENGNPILRIIKS